MSDWTAPIELSIDTPRNVKINGLFALGISVIVFLFVPLIVLIPALFVSSYYKQESLKECGVTVQGKILSGQVTSGKGGKSYRFVYKYCQENNSNKLIEGEDFLSSYDFFFS